MAFRSSVGDEEGSLVAARSLRMQEVPALSDHHLKTHERIQHILVTRLQTTFSALISSDVFPVLRGKMWIGRNPKVDFEELLLPWQQSWSTWSCHLHPISWCTPAPSGSISEQKTRLVLVLLQRPAGPAATPSFAPLISNAHFCSFRGHNYGNPAALQKVPGSGSSREPS